MKRLFRWAFRLFLVLLALLVAVVLLLDIIVREIVEYQIRHRTGLAVKIRSIQVGLLNPRVTVEKLVLYNSAEFGGTPLLDMPELHLEYDRDALWAHKLHFKLLRLNVARINVVEDKLGRLNLELLQQQTAVKVGGALSSNKTAAGYQLTRIDALNLTLGQANFTSFKDPAHSDLLNVGILNQSLTNVTAWKDLNAVLMFIKFRNPDDARNFEDRLKYWFDRPGLKK